MVKGACSRGRGQGRRRIQAGLLLFRGLAWQQWGEGEESTYETPLHSLMDRFPEIINAWRNDKSGERWQEKSCRHVRLSRVDLILS